MTLIINGTKKIFQENSTLDDIIISLNIKSKIMAAAVNMEIVKKKQWDAYILKNNDELELLQFVGGG